MNRQKIKIFAQFHYSCNSVLECVNLSESDNSFEWLKVMAYSHYIALIFVVG